MNASSTQFSELLVKLSDRINMDLLRTERIFSDMLHVLRDNLPYDKAVLLYKELPEYMRNFYTSGWNNSEVEKPADKFLEFKAQFLRSEADVLEESFKEDQEVKRFLINILKVLRDLVPVIKLKKIILALPKDLQESVMQDVFPK